MAVLNAMLSGGERRSDDFYPTPPEATRALLPWIEDFPRGVWEPACGDGALAEVLRKAGYAVTPTDLVDRGYGKGGIDFLGTRSAWGAAIVTNPPFKLAQQFIEHAERLGIGHMALLLKSNFWQAKRRAPLFRRWRPHQILALNWRLDFTGAGAPHTDCMWCIWRPAGLGIVSYDIVDKPGGAA
ncbi:hypothetical protein GGR16_002659 [Chelatococcus caeni]|uniref:SAM-dependent methyltransferase n=1 Tax=Chelatococcus caeni TaxID=1348468 RepID=A0A840BW98_9HYPH|nr:SAM-dependent DNA methyltransferase [Chelatococcus caeni]MBB4017625.1 hypothetical protein [Chelatococcus caeni]